MPPPVTRRSLLGWVGASAAAGALPLPLTLPALAQQVAEGRTHFYLTQAEARFLTAAVDRILPKDTWPSASEAGVVDFIDFELAGPWGQGQGFYRAGPHAPGTPQQGYQLPHTPAELYREAIAHADESIGGQGFAGLAPDAQDGYLRRLDGGEVRLGSVGGRDFFRQLRANTVEGYFADPLYNGNRDAVGWRMVGFPGAHAYYLTEVGRHDLDYAREPMGVGWQPGLGEPPPVSPAGVGARP